MILSVQNSQNTMQQRLDHVPSLQNEADEMEIEILSLEKENRNLKRENQSLTEEIMQVRIDLKKLQSDNIRLAKAVATDTDTITAFAEDVQSFTQDCHLCSVCS
jgi:chromosome segregation ATPase